tara:strand:- start:1467 stop:1772 length:306 start_codon:yes stop_codon:yes gene_type:complete
MADRYNPNTVIDTADPSGTEVERASEMTRLDQGVRKLVSNLRSGEQKILLLEERIDSNERKIRELEEQLTVAGDRRRDVLKKVDELVGWIDNVIEGEAHFD